VEQWHVVSPLDQQLVNLWAIVDAHRREDPDFKVRRWTPPAAYLPWFGVTWHPLLWHHGCELLRIDLHAATPTSVLAEASSAAPAGLTPAACIVRRSSPFS
jgi:hypothetical protein